MQPERPVQSSLPPTSAARARASSRHVRGALGGRAARTAAYRRWRARAHVVAAGVASVAVVGALGVAVSGASATTTVAEGTYTLTNACGGKLLDVKGVSTADGANVHVYSANSLGNQQWTVAATGGGYYKLTAKHSGKVLDVDDAKTGNGANVQQWAWADVPQQQWQFSDAGSGRYRLSPRHATGKSLDVSGASTANGANVQLWDSNSTCAQQWTLTRVGGGTSPTPTPTPTQPPSSGRTLFGAENGSGYFDSAEHNERAAGELARLGLDAARMGMDFVQCDTVDEPCDFAQRDVAVQKHLDAGIAIHSVIAFRAHVEGSYSDVAGWERNFRSKCGRVAEHYDGRIGYYIIDNEPDLAYGEGIRAKAEPELVVRFQRACYEAIKAVNPAILVESSPAMSPATSYNERLLAAGIADYADVIGTHMYGGQITPAEDAIGVLKGYMAKHGVDKPIACSECGTSLAWTPSGQDPSLTRAQWLRDAAAYARAEGLHNVMFFSMFSIHGPEWEMDQDERALDALYDIGHAD